jgi:tellurite resistance protein TehA-like permease
MRRLILVPLVLCVVAQGASATMIESGQKLAAVLSVFSILISLPAFVSLYIHVRRTNLGKILFQPLLAMFVGFFGLMLNSIIQIWQVFNGVEVSNKDLVLGINSAISTLLIAVGAVMMFFSVKERGLLPMEYYQRKEPDEETHHSAKPRPAARIRKKR